MIDQVAKYCLALVRGMRQVLSPPKLILAPFALSTPMILNLLPPIEIILPIALDLAKNAF